MAWWQRKLGGWATYRIADVEDLRQRANRQRAEIEAVHHRCEQLEIKLEGAQRREGKLIDGLVPVYVAHKPLLDALEELARIQLRYPETEQGQQEHGTVDDAG
jgi:hypothetical protein